MPTPVQQSRPQPTEQIVAEAVELTGDAARQMLAHAAPLPEVPDTMRGQSFTYALSVRFKLR